MSITARPACSTRFARRTSPRVRPAALRSISAPIRYRSTAAAWFLWIRQAMKRSPACALAAPRSRISSCLWSPPTTASCRRRAKPSTMRAPPTSPSSWPSTKSTNPKRSPSASSRPDPRGDRTNDGKFRRPAERGGRDDQGRPPPALLAAGAGVEIGPDQISRLGQVGHGLFDDFAADLGPPVERVAHRFGRDPPQELRQRVARARRGDDDPVARGFDLDLAAFANPDARGDILGDAQAEAVAPAREPNLHGALSRRWSILRISGRRSQARRLGGLDPVYRPRLAHPAQRVAAERDEAAAGTERRGELGGNQKVAAEAVAQRLDARDLVDRRADDGEVEPVDRADIVVRHLAEMQREIDRGGRLCGGGPRRGEPVERRHRLDRGVERAAAGRGVARRLAGKDRQHA